MSLIEGPLVVAADAWTILAKDLPAAERQSLGAEYPLDSAVLGRRASRTHSVVVTKPVLDLFEEFRKPTTTALAIARYAARTGQSAEQVLQDSIQVLFRLRQAGLLALEGEVQVHGPVFADGDRLGRWLVRRCLQSYDESDVYLAEDDGGAPVVCKVGRATDNPEIGHALRREAAAMRLLLMRGARVPALIALVTAQGQRPVLTMGYIVGGRVDYRAQELRENSPAELVTICAKTIRALAAIHAQGLLHGDVHGGNYILDEDGQVSTIDLSDVSSVDRPRDRRGVPRLMDPQWASARLAGEPNPANSAAAEQYSMAALVCFLLAGRHHYGTPARVDGLQLALADGRLTDWFERLSSAEPAGVWAVLRRALAVDPADRWSSTEEFAAAFEAAAPTYDGLPTPPVLPGIQRVRSRLSCFAAPPGHPLRAREASVSSGVAGTAVSLLLASSELQDPVLLAWADLWGQEAADAGAGVGGIWHGRLGVLAVRLAISSVFDDRNSRSRALESYLLEHSGYERSGAPLDLTNGLASNVLMDAHLLTLLGDVPQLREAGSRAAIELTERTAALGPGPGVAHGPAGHLLALLAWSAATEHPSHDQAAVLDRLTDLSADASQSLGGISPWRRTGWEASWCNGASGIALTLLTAAETLGEGTFVSSAEAAMRRALDGQPRGYDLCCGYAGRAYVLARLAQVTGADYWRLRAREDLERLEPAWDAMPRDGLTKGRPGGLGAVLAVETSGLRMPLIDAPAAALAERPGRQPASE